MLRWKHPTPLQALHLSVASFPGTCNAPTRSWISSSSVAAAIAGSRNIRFCNKLKSIIKVCGNLKKFLKTEIEQRIPLQLALNRHTRLACISNALNKRPRFACTANVLYTTKISNNVLDAKISNGIGHLALCISNCRYLPQVIRCLALGIDDCWQASSSIIYTGAAGIGKSPCGCNNKFIIRFNQGPLFRSFQ